jgi:hypothetical protein
MPRSPRELVLNTLKKAVKNVEAELAKMVDADKDLKKDAGSIPKAPAAPKAPKVVKDEYCSAPPVEKASVDEVNAELKGFKSLAPKLPGTGVSQVNSEMKGFRSLASDPTSMPKLPGIAMKKKALDPKAGVKKGLMATNTNRGLI